MPEVAISRWLETIDAKLDRLLSLETRVAVLESRSVQQDEVAQEVRGMRDLGPLREKVALIEDGAKVREARLTVLEKAAERREGLTDGVKLVWFLAAGAPGAVAIILQIAELLGKR